MVAATDERVRCGGARRLHAVGCEGIRAKRPPREPTGVIASCHDCHIPHQYPEPWYKAKAGIKDAIGEMRGVISTEEKFKKERLRMAKLVWEEYRRNNSENCQHCHAFTAEVVSKQKDFVQPMHQQFLSKAMTCIDCHKGIAHEAPAE